MDELVDAVANSVTVSNEPLNVSAPHPRYSQYKIKAEKWSQDERRKKLLDIQKQNRFDYVRHIRNLSDNNWDNMSYEDNEEEQMDVEVTVKKPGRHYKDQLMLSEWMVEVPSDISTEWVLVPCPMGKRNLVVAGQGKTKAYAKNGYCIETFSSHLPGGGQHLPRYGKEWALLDCIFDEVAQTFYILDIMGWVNQVFYDSETEFRFFWLQTKVSDVSELETVSSDNVYRFINLPKYSCTQQGISDALGSISPNKLDGLLFYHKRTHYTFGSTPLVTWLKPYMVPDVLGYTIPEVYLQKKPSSYTTYGSHLEQVEKDKALSEQKSNKKQYCRREKHSKQRNGMDVDYCTVDRTAAVVDETCMTDLNFAQLSSNKM